MVRHDLAPINGHREIRHESRRAVPANAPLRIEAFELPETGPTHVRVRLVAAGVCHSDWHVIKGAWPHLDEAAVRAHPPRTA